MLIHCYTGAAQVFSTEEAVMLRKAEYELHSVSSRMKAIVSDNTSALRSAMKKMTDAERSWSSTLQKMATFAEKAESSLHKAQAHAQAGQPAQTTKHIEVVAKAMESASATVRHADGWRPTAKAVVRSVDTARDKREKAIQDLHEKERQAGKEETTFPTFEATNTEEGLLSVVQRTLEDMKAALARVENAVAKCDGLEAAAKLTQSELAEARKSARRLAAAAKRAAPDSAHSEEQGPAQRPRLPLSDVTNLPEQPRPLNVQPNAIASGDCCSS